ncbi:MAG TPA: divalent-cation tolerance protein CutA [Thermoplasmata archaeon]|nr:divalent-cation tolerance protein CutA [Thermoplasmata archaeon]
MSPYPADPEWARGPMRLVLTTYPGRDRALSAIGGVLERRLAACGSVVPIDSRYWWKGRVLSETEALVVFKTVPKRVGALFRFLEEGHPYEVPEIVEIDVPRATAGYLAYLSATLDRAVARSAPTRRRAAPRAPAARGPGRTRARRRPPSTRTGSR